MTIWHRSFAYILLRIKHHIDIFKKNPSLGVRKEEEN